MDRVEFVKVEAAGNDFVLVDGRRAPPGPPEALARALCPRRLGVGADGLIVVEGAWPTPSVAHFEPDGARTFCLNALRGVVAWAVAAGATPWRGGRPRAAVTLVTDAGRLPVAVRALQPGATSTPAEVRVDVGLPAPARRGRLVVPGLRGDVEAWHLDVGNPQLVVPCAAEDLEHPELLSRARALRWRLDLFPAGANVSFVAPAAPAPDDGAGWAIRTWERGVEGETLACGTAVLAAAWALGRPGEDVAVRTRGGAVQRVALAADGARAWAEGPARVVARGEALVPRARLAA